MSAFRPENYAEAVATHKPLSRATPLLAVSKRRARTLSPTESGKPLRRDGIKRKAAKKKARRVKVSTLKNRAWKQFSIFIRSEGADPDGFNKCVTCDVRKHWKELQAGHFIRGRLNSNLFDERGVWPQCYSCNVGAQGNVVIYYKFMLEKFGQQTIDELILQNNTTRKWLPGELQEICKKYGALNDANPLLREAS